jgi:hypothetical protein
MKKMIFLIALILLIPSFAFATAGSWGTPAPVYNQGSPFKTWTIIATCGTGGDAGVIPNYTTTAADIAFMKDWYIFIVETIGVVTVPDNGYNLTIKNTAGLDVMGGALANRSNSATVGQWAIPALGSINIPAPVTGALTIGGTNNSVTGSKFSIKIYLVR